MSNLVWTDNPLTTSTHIRAVHVNELRSAVDRDRAAVGLGTYPWTDAPVTSSVHIRAVHFTELRSAIQDLWNHAGMGNLPNWSVGSAPSPSRQISLRDTTDLRTWVGQYDPASIVGAQWTNNARNWAGKAGWDIELVYATNPPGGFDINSVASRVQSARQSGRNVLVRVDYAGPSSPGGPSQAVPANDTDRATYVQFLQAMCQNAAYNQNAWGYIIGNEYNLSSENGGGTPITPTWYARVFNGYSASPGDTGNAVQSVKTYQPGAHVLVGPVGPWSLDANSSDTYSIDMPWLNYFNEVCKNVYAGAAPKGIAVDGFSIHAYGRPTAINPNTGQPYGASEPHNDIQGSGWAAGAWAGFTVYKNWRDIINQFSAAVSVFITETNTDTGSGSQSNTTYPSGWYQAALAEISGAGPRFWALCWFVDVNYGGNWTNDSLTDGTGNCALANADFNNALISTPY